MNHTCFDVRKSLERLFRHSSGASQSPPSRCHRQKGIPEPTATLYQAPPQSRPIPTHSRRRKEHDSLDTHAHLILFVFTHDLGPGRLRTPLRPISASKASSDLTYRGDHRRRLGEGLRGNEPQHPAMSFGWQSPRSPQG